MYLTAPGSVTPYDFGMSGYMGGMNPMFGGSYGMGMGMGTSPLLSFMPGAYGYQDPKKIMDLYKKQNELGYELTNMSINNSDRSQRMQESVMTRRATEATAVQDQANNLASTIIRGRSNQVIPQFEKFVNLLGDLPMYEHLRNENPAQLRSLAKEQFQKLYRTPIEGAVQDNLSGSLMTGFKAGASFGTYNKPSASTIVDKLTGTDGDLLEKFEETIGATLGGAATAGVLGTIGAALLKKPIVALGAAIVGGIGGLLIGAKKSVTA